MIKVDLSTLTYHIVDTVPHWNALRYGKDDSRGLSCGSALNIHQDVLKSGNLLHKQEFVDSQFDTTVIRYLLEI